MSRAATVLGLDCPRCRARYPESREWARVFAGCPRCRAAGVAANLTVALDLAGIGPDAFPTAPRTMWRFDRLLPVSRERAVTLGEGGTPLVRLERLGRRLGLSRLYAKDESRNPTWSYKDRLCSVAVSHAAANGARVITISSTGNHGASTAAYAARAGLPCVIFTLASVPDTMKVLMQAYGAAVIECPTSESRWELMRQGIERLGWYPTSGFVVPPVGSPLYGIEGYKTIAYEIVEDLGEAPDVVVVPSSYSDGVAGIWKGFVELRELRRIPRAPRMIAAEPFGPLAHALEEKLEAPEPVEGGASVAFSIASRYGTYQGLAALRASEGAATRITDEGVFEAQRALGREEGLFVEPSSAASLTAVMQLSAQRALDPDALVVVVLTSAGLKDPGASRAWLPAVPAAGGDFDTVLAALRDSYGLALE
ncbi:MAG: pyridoxal-phosphate dependent enzyme [Candidatus Rokubacteria bacterium]|nr:pyridoxal-phosphate dependent enzyme [Candidatus Rokubacteria bacterium]